MKLTRRLASAALFTALATAASLGLAQESSQAKKDLVAKVLKLQQPGIESVGAGLANQTANQVLQVAGQALNRLPADKREAVFNDLQAEVRKFFEDIAPSLRDRAVKLAPSTIGVSLEEKFSEDELKTLIAWLESPVSRKYGQVAGDIQQTLGAKLVADSRAQVEPKLKALEQVLTAKLSAAGGGGAAAPAAPASKAAAGKPAKAAKN
jgi:hypothetical protein